MAPASPELGNAMSWLGEKRAETVAIRVIGRLNQGEVADLKSRESSIYGNNKEPRKQRERLLFVCTHTEGDSEMKRELLSNQFIPIASAASRK